ncbi:glycosyltransferase [Gillisia sp. JM1]|uniref:glycosyltransferase n=1 Tax=Gillisia sp. JM1 TaxID=1283286 RepID=UPI0003F9487F|nr:glycosyltransferase [Gillisia sp. JM1]
MNIALLSPNKNAYSETFIQAHKQLLQGNIFYYFNGELPTQLEGGLVLNSRSKRILDIIKGHFNLNRFTLEEQALISSFKKNKISLVFAEYGTTGEKIVSICKALNLSLIVHFHGFDASVKSVIKQNDNYKRVFETARFIIVVSKKMYQDLIKMGCPEIKLIYNVCGPNEKFLQVKPNFNKLQFISIGRFVNKKAPYYLILSFIKVLDKYPEAKLIMAGEGELLNTCKNLVDYYGLQSNIEFPGVISPDKYREYLSESLAMVQHSLTADNGDAEGTPVGILEASAAGIPVISTNHAGIPDVIINGVTGLLVEEHDVVGMAEKMIYLIDQKRIAIDLGQRGKENICKHYSLDLHIRSLNEIIELSFK